MKTIIRIRVYFLFFVALLANVMAGSWILNHYSDSKEYLVKYLPEKTGQDSLINEIVLVNFRYLDDLSVAKTIQLVDLFKPKVIGVDYEVAGPIELDYKSHSPLVYVSYWEGDSLIKTIVLIDSSEGISFGEATYDSYLSFYPYCEDDGQIVEDFSLALMKYYDKSKYDFIRNSLDKNKYYIPYVYNFPFIDNITKLSFPDLKHLIKDKIVIVGFFGNEDAEESKSDLHANHHGPIYGGYIIANKVYTLLIGGAPTMGAGYYVSASIVLILLFYFIAKSIKISFWGYLLLKVLQLLAMFGVLFLLFVLANKAGILAEVSGFFIIILVFPEMIFWARLFMKMNRS